MNHNYSVFSNLSDRDKVDFFIALAVVILAGAFILLNIVPSLSLSDSDNKNILVDNSQAIEKVEIKDAVYVPVTNEVLKRNRIAPISKIKTNELPHNISSSRKENPIVKDEYPLSTKKETTLKVEEKINVVDTLTTDSTIVTNTDKIDQDNSANETINEVPVTKRPEKAIIQRDDRECIIVIGAYGKQKSIDKLLRRLKNENYKIFRTPYKSLSRIGVYLPCDKVTIEKELIKLRKNYAKDAMLLRKDEN